MSELRTVMDFETRSCANLEDVGAIEYAKHESTSVFCLGYKINDGPCKLWIPERAPMPADLWETFQQGTLVAQNAGFERAITKWTLTRYPLLTSEQREFLFNLKPSRWQCTAAKAAASSLPRSLENANRVLELPTQKDLHGHKLIKKYSKPRRPSKKNPKLWWDDRKDLRDIYRYCLVDVQAEYELDQALPDLTEYEQKVWELDQKINDRGILIDIPTVKIILRLIAEETHNITKAVQKLSHGEIEKVTQTARVLKWLNQRGAKMPNLQAATIEQKLLDKKISQDIRHMLEFRQGGSKTSTSKYITMLKAVGEDHRARELLLYHGAVPTGRWAGKRIQPHNFPRPTIKGFNMEKAVGTIQKQDLKAIRFDYGVGPTTVMKVLSAATRGMLVASPGNEFFCADYAAVEARIAFWVSEHRLGLKAFEEDRKLYEEMAAAAFGKDLAWLCSKEGKESLERFVGKESVLGCQYGMGWLKFKNQCHKKGMTQVTDEIAKKAVYAYRRLHAPVVKFWSDIENAVAQAILNPGSVYKVTKVTVYKRGKWLNIRLPSGRRLRYYSPRVSQKQLASGKLVPQIHYWTWNVKYGWVEEAAWGGVFTNHIVQGIARDLMVNGIFNIENAGYEFLLSVHDEGLSERKKGLGSVQEYVSLMTKLPHWAKGAPIKAEGWTGPRYKKG